MTLRRDSTLSSTIRQRSVSDSPGGRDQVRHVPFGRYRLRISGLHRARGLGREHAQADQVQHAAQPRDILLTVPAVPAGLGALRPDAVPAMP